MIRHEAGMLFIDDEEGIPVDSIAITRTYENTSVDFGRRYVSRLAEETIDINNGEAVFDIAWGIVRYVVNRRRRSAREQAQRRRDTAAETVAQMDQVLADLVARLNAGAAAREEGFATVGGLPIAQDQRLAWERYHESRARAEAAEERAAFLLDQHLDDRQRQQLSRMGHFTVAGKHLSYKVGTTYVMASLPGQSPHAALCVFPKKPMPRSDQLLAIKLTIEGDEAGFLKTANAFSADGEVPYGSKLTIDGEFEPLLTGG